MGQTVLQHLTINSLHVTKKQATEKDCMNLSNSYKYVLKCYLNVFTIVLAEIGSI